MPSPVNTLVTLTVQAGTLTTEVESVQKQERLSSSTIYEVHLQVGESREHRLILLERPVMRQLELLRDLRVRTLRAVPQRRKITTDQQPRREDHRNV